MGSTLAEKLLARHAGLAQVRAGDLVVAGATFAMVHDARAPNTIRMVEKMGAKSLPFAHKTAWVLDHFSPPPTLEAAQGHTAMRQFADQAQRHAASETREQVCRDGRHRVWCCTRERAAASRPDGALLRTSGGQFFCRVFRFIILK
jgi:homoaconitase/3-isopropylmalate dehydratase large subunit